VSQHIDVERSHEDAWYRRVVEEGFFERAGFRQLQQANLAALRRKVPLTADMRVLSIGCGSGEYEVALAREVGRVVGLDLSPVAVHAAVTRAHAAGVANASFMVTAIGGDVDLGAAPFDVVIAFGVLHHLGEESRRQALHWLRQQLVTGGWLYVRDPNARGVLRRLAGARARRDEFHSPNEQAIDPRALVDDVRGAGFTHVDVDYTDVLLGPLPWMLAGGPRVLWKAVALFDRAWVATPFLRPLASQIAVVARV
jgi:2-polyprenyl-3-methyl-5-hydroxy-6-metoxy-1,4-benzoquinol methylase